MPAPEPSARKRSGRPAWLPVAAAAGVVAVAILLAVLLRDGDEDQPAVASAPSATATTAPAAADPVAIARLAEETNRPIFWVGPAAGRTYELTRTPDGSVYIRYLDPGVSVGDERPNFVTVGTYPQRRAFATVEAATERAGAQVERLGDEGLAVANRARPNSWYLAYPDSEALVEVYAPQGGRARELVRSGRVVPVTE